MGAERRYPIEPLAEAMRCTVWQACKRVGIHHTYLNPGLPAHLADRFAIRAGLHPAQVWDSWVADGLTPLDEVFLEQGWRQAWLWREGLAA